MLRRVSVLADLLALLAVGGLTIAVLKITGRPSNSLDTFLFMAFVPLWPLIGASMGAYHPHLVGQGLSITTPDEFATIFQITTVWSWFLLVGRTLANEQAIQVLPSLLVWAFGIVVVLTFRSLLRRLARRRGWYKQSVLVIGRRRDAGQILSRIRRHPEWGLSVAREIDVADDGEGEAVALDASTLSALVEELGVSRVIFATPPEQLHQRTGLTRSLIEAGTQVDFVPGEAEILRSGAEISDLEGLPLMSMPGASPPRSWSAIKRIVDLGVGIPILILASPALAYAAVRVKLDSPGPILYRQTRVGRDGRHFQFLKIRTMVAGADTRLDEVAELSMFDQGAEEGIFKAIDDPRVTKAGRSLRRRSLDELPQLWNVVRGDMSLVGPRPLPVAEDERVGGHYELRRLVKPGMTGPWQVSGRSDIPFADMLRLDYSYVLNRSLAADLRVLVQTADAVIRGRGAY